MPMVMPWVGNSLRRVSKAMRQRPSAGARNKPTTPRGGGAFGHLLVQFLAGAWRQNDLVDRQQVRAQRRLLSGLIEERVERGLLEALRAAQVIDLDHRCGGVRVAARIQVAAGKQPQGNHRRRLWLCFLDAHCLQGLVHRLADAAAGAA